MSHRTRTSQSPVEGAFDVDPHDTLDAPRRETDPVVRRLGIIAFLIVIVWLSGVITALATGQLTSKAPRTSVERAIRVYEGDIAANKMTPEKWADYINVLASAGQYGRAEQVVETARATAGSSESLITLAEARLESARGDYPAAIKAAELCITQAREELEALKAEAAKKGVPFTQKRLEQEETAVLLMAGAYEQEGDSARAIERYTTFLEYQPTAADVFIRRADLRAAAGDTAGAEEDYRAALRFVADDPAALAGLKKIGASSK